MKILLTNDDGINAKGINILANALSSHHEVSIVSPTGQCSACSHSLTVHGNIEYFKYEDENLKYKYAVSGKPADCVKLAVLSLFKDNLPDLIISGINDASNLGCDILYSGTVAGAMEGIYMGIKSIAVSLYAVDNSEPDFELTANFICANLDKLLAFDIGSSSMLNINHPNCTPEGVVITKAGYNHYSDYYASVSEDTPNIVQIYGSPLPHAEEDADISWASKKYITISPLTVDRTDYVALNKIRGTKI